MRNLIVAVTVMGSLMIATMTVWAEEHTSVTPTDELGNQEQTVDELVLGSVLKDDDGTLGTVVSAGTSLYDDQQVGQFYRIRWGDSATDVEYSDETLQKLLNQGAFKIVKSGEAWQQQSTVANTGNDNDKVFFSGPRLGMTIQALGAYYKKFANIGALEHSGAPPGERQVDFRTSTDPQRRVYIFFRKVDNKIVSIMYWKLGDGETFSADERDHLTNLNRGYGSITTRIVEGGSGFEVTTARQRQIEGDAY